MKRSMILSAVTAACLLSAAGQAQVVISQVYGGGGNSGAPVKNDFVELKNIGTTTIDIAGWTIQRTGNTANFTAPQMSAPISGNTSLAPGQYFLIECAAGANLAAPALPTPDFSATALTLGSGDGKVALVASATLLSITNPADFDQTTKNPVNPLIRDFVGYGILANYFEGTGPTINTSNANSISRGSNGCTETNNNLGDFTVLGAPSPHNRASIVPCGVAFPDVALQLSNSGCQPTVSSAYDVTAQVSNLQALAADGTSVTVVLPPALTYVSSAPSAGTTSYNAGTRTLTWSAGTLGANASASLVVNTTVNAVAGLTVTATASTTTPNDPVGNNSASNSNEVTASGTPLSVIAVGSFVDSSLSTSVFDEGGTERELGTIYRTFTSLDGNWIIFRTDLAGVASAENGAVIIGHNVAGTWTYSMVAREGRTAPIVAMPNAKIDNSGVNLILGINNAGEYVYSTVLRDEMGTPGVTADDVLTDAVVKGTVAGGISMVIAEGDAAPAFAGRTYATVRSSTIQNDGTVSFMASLSGTAATNAAFLKNNGNTVLAQKGVTIPGNAATVLDFLDDDGSSDGRGLMVSADGTSWIGTGEVQSAVTTDDNVVVVNGTVAVREGSTVGSFTDPAAWATFGTQQVPWVQMLPDASWYIHGYNPATAGFNQGQDWVMRNGTVLTATGNQILSGDTESWADNVLQRTFFVAAGSGNDFVIGGLTNRSTAANGSDTATDGVVVYRGSSLLVREGAPVEVAPSDVRYLNLINDNRSFVAGGKLYMTATLRNANSICTQNFSNLPQAIVAIDLPATNPCPADIGQQGGTPGSDGQLNNNDFIVFIDYFFASNPIADVGQQGGTPGSDGQFNNNDFIVFIDLFFAGC